MFAVNRYPVTENNSLKAWNAADVLLLEWFNQKNISKTGTTVIFNDRFGFLTVNLYDKRPLTVVGYKSQEKACIINLEKNHLDRDMVRFILLSGQINGAVETALIKIPKSIGLFKLYLYLIYKNSIETTEVACGFMTKYFNKQMLAVAAEFFEIVEQTKAYKKARLLLLRNPKISTKQHKLIETFVWKGLNLKQYAGVFSSSKIDFATRFLLENFTVNHREKRILDLGCGNGIIGLYIRKQYEDNCFEIPELHLLDDAVLAVESAKMNLPSDNCAFHFDNTLDKFEDSYFDLIITNPPFHFEYEVNTEISIKLFREAFQKLSNKGRFVLVFNRHLTTLYRPLLNHLFEIVNLLADSPKYMALECIKA